jgi:hypothetical protein
MVTLGAAEGRSMQLLKRRFTRPCRIHGKYALPFITETVAACCLPFAKYLLVTGVVSSRNLGGLASSPESSLVIAGPNEDPRHSDSAWPQPAYRCW